MTQWASPLDEVDIDETQKRDLMCEIGRRCHDLRFCEANGGNLSCRLDAERVLCTPTMISKGYMTPDDLVVLDLDGNQLEGHRQKTSEILIHLLAYRQRPDAQAVVHAHPRTATAFGLVGKALPIGALPEIEYHLGVVGRAEYGRAGSPDLPKRIAPHLQKSSIILMANHGVLTIGTGLIDAFWKMDMIESYCDTVTRAMAMGLMRLTDR